jgi:hypothetical protein
MRALTRAEHAFGRRAEIGQGRGRAGRRSRRCARLPRPGRPCPRRRAARSGGVTVQVAPWLSAAKPRGLRISCDAYSTAAIRPVSAAQGRVEARSAPGRPGGSPVTVISDGSPPHRSRIRGRQLQAGDHGMAGVDPAREPVLGVGGDAELAAGLGRADRIEPGAFDEDVGGLVRAAGGLAAHDAAQADGAFAAASAMTHIFGPGRVGLAVQGDQVLARRVGRDLPAAHDDLASRPAWPRHRRAAAGPVVGDQIGDIDQGVDRRRPMAVSRSCSQSGDGPFFTPRISRPAKTGTSPVRPMAIGEGKVPGTGLISWRSGRRCRWPPDRARCPRRPASRAGWGDLEVDHRLQAEDASAAGVPTLSQAAIQVQDAVGLPSSSSSEAEHSMPLETTPRTGFSTRVTPRPGT